MNETQETPEPFEEPTPVEAAEIKPAKTTGEGSSLLGLLGLGAFGAFVLIGFMPVTCAGAGSASRLNWKQRQAAIEESIRQQTDVQTPAPNGNERTTTANE